MKEVIRTISNFNKLKVNLNPFKMNIINYYKSNN